MDATSEHVTAAVAARALGVSESTIRTLVQRHLLTPVCRTPQLRFAPAELARYAAERRSRGGQAVPDVPSSRVPLLRLRLDPPLFDALIDRAPDARSMSLQAAHDLERYYELLRAELATLALTEAQASLICDALNGTATLDGIERWLRAEVEDAIRLNNLDQKWSVDGAGLVMLLRDCTPGQRLAIVDAAERFWARAGNGKATGDDLRAVGLVR